MTGEDAVYAEWLNLLGSDEIKDHDPDILRDLHLMHEVAEASHSSQVYDSTVCVDPRCPAGRTHYGRCPGPHRKDPQS
jgi:hypothetical protein